MVPLARTLQDKNLQVQAMPVSFIHNINTTNRPSIYCSFSHRLLFWRMLAFGVSLHHTPFGVEVQRTGSALDFCS